MKSLVVAFAGLVLATSASVPAKATLVRIKVGGVVTFADGSMPVGANLSIDMLLDVDPQDVTSSHSRTPYEDVSSSYYVTKPSSILRAVVRVGAVEFGETSVQLDRYRRLGQPDNCCDDYTYSTFRMIFFDGGLSTVDVMSFGNLFGAGIFDPIILTGNAGTFGFENVGDNTEVQGNVTALASSVVPEPASWQMLLGGFGLVGAAMRLRRKQSLSFG